ALPRKRRRARPQFHKVPGRMPIEMPRGLPFAVDTWGPSSRRRRHRFL
uniref:Uncharacterized protein n=1 Tax=Aegilops tauschii subsp. strangulata TaxID=200361 RepID=A0A453G7D3_AEGTS